MPHDNFLQKSSRPSGARTGTGMLPRCQDAVDPTGTLAHSTLDRILTELGEIRATLAGTRKPYLTVEEVAQITGRSAYTVRRWISEKRLDAKRIAGTGPKGRLLIPTEQVTRLIKDGKGGKIPDVFGSAD
jgi:excisionase family DNA binding protein